MSKIGDKVSALRGLDYPTVHKMGGPGAPPSSLLGTIKKTYKDERTNLVWHWLEFPANQKDRDGWYEDSEVW